MHIDPSLEIQSHNKNTVLVHSVSPTDGVALMNVAAAGVEAADVFVILKTSSYVSSGKHFEHLWQLIST